MADGTGRFGDDDGGGGAAPSPQELAGFDLNDFGMAMRFIRCAGGVVDKAGDVSDLSACLVLYIPENGWVSFNGKHWDLKAGESIARRLAAKVARGMFAQAEVLASKHDSEKEKRTIKEYYDFAESAGNASKLENMLRVAKSYLEVDLTSFDRDPLAINVRNGTLKFTRKRDAKGKPIAFEMVFQERHMASDRITRMCDVEWHPQAEAPEFLKAFQTWQPVAEDRRYIQTLSGYGATACTEEQIFIIFQGRGRDGKSTFMNIFRKIMGSYACTASVQTFLDTGQRSGSDASPDIARLAGDTRLVSTAEPPKNAKLADDMIKSMTGGGNLAARKLKHDIFEFEPVAKVFLECNGRPQPQGLDDGIWRRLKLALWEQQIPEGQEDKELKHKLDRERPGIFRWIIEGVGLWLTDGIKDPKRVKEAGADYRKGANPAAEWLAEYVVRDRAAETPASDFYKSYKAFCEERDEKPMSQTSLGKLLGEQQILRGKKDRFGRVMRFGARLKTDAEIVAEREEEGKPGAGGGSLGGDGGSASLPPDDEDDNPFGGGDGQ